MEYQAQLHNGWHAKHQHHAQQEVQADEIECLVNLHNGVNEGERAEPPSQADLDELLAHLAPKIGKVPVLKPEKKRCDNGLVPIAMDTQVRAPPGLETPMETSKSGAIACKGAAIKVSNRYQELAKERRQKYRNKKVNTSGSNIRGKWGGAEGIDPPVHRR